MGDIRIPDSPYTYSIQKGLELSAETGNSVARAHFLRAAGHVYCDDGQYHRAMDCYQQSQEIGDSLGMILKSWERIQTKICEEKLRDQEIGDNPNNS